MIHAPLNSLDEAFAQSLKVKYAAAKAAQPKRQRPLAERVEPEGDGIILPEKSAGPFTLESDARVFIINLDTVNGLRLLQRMINQQSASLHRSDGSRWEHMQRSVEGDGFLFWYNRAGASICGKAVSPIRAVSRGPNRSPNWDIYMGSFWRPMRRELRFKAIDNMMGNRISDRGIIAWTIFELTELDHLQAHEVFRKCMSLT